MKTNVHDFDKQTCSLFNPFQMFAQIHKKTNGDPCTTGCAWYQGGNCQGYKNLTKEKAKIVKSNLSTNAEIAEKLKCSPRQVSKMRKTGELPDKYM